MLGLSDKIPSGLKFLFADTLNQKEILKELTSELSKETVDLVVVDSFGDVFQGVDLNNNAMVRSTVRSFDKIAKKYKCLIVFIHHINKAAYNSSPGQKYIQGGSGLVQKIRTALFISEGKGPIRYLSIVKGNYTPRKHKELSIELSFSEENFLFTRTGNNIQTAHIGNANNHNEKPENIKNLAIDIFKDQAFKYNDFIQEFKNVTSLSTTSAKRYIDKFVNEGIVLKTDGTYHLNPDIIDEPQKPYQI